MKFIRHTFALLLVALAGQTAARAQEEPTLHGNAEQTWLQMHVLRAA